MIYRVNLYDMIYIYTHMYILDVGYLGAKGREMGMGWMG